jgi:hypothetical protein
MIPFVTLSSAIYSTPDAFISINVNHIIAYSNGFATNYSNKEQIPCCMIFCVGEIQYNVKETASQVLKLINNSQKEN